MRKEPRFGVSLRSDKRNRTERNPGLRILLAYARKGWTTGVYYQRALEQIGTVDLLNLRSETVEMINRGANLGGKLIGRPGKFAPYTEGGGLASFDLKAFLGPTSDVYDLIVVIESPWQCIPVSPPPGVPSAFVANDSAYRTDFLISVAAEYGHTFVSQRSKVSSFARLCSRASWLPFAADPEIHFPLKGEMDHDLAFVGHAFPGLYSRRIRCLNILKAQFRVLVEEAYGTKMCGVYARAPIGFNCTGLSELNMRVFEVLACGRILLTDQGLDGIHELLPSETPIVEYTEDGTVADAAAKAIGMARDHPELLARAREIILSGNTYRDRANALVSACLGASVRSEAA